MQQSPFFRAASPVSVVMLKVLAALLPGIAAAVYHFGVGVLLQLLLASCSALAVEALALHLRRQPLRALFDGSALVSAWLLALSLPPLAPWWLAVLGATIAVAVGKQLYGGLGNNPFNPAMVGFAVLIVAFPAPMSRWAAPLPLPAADLEPLAQLALILTGQLPASLAWDALASATPLDALRTGLSQGVALASSQQGPLFGALAGVGGEWVAAGYLLGGLWLLQQKLIRWTTPLAVLGSLAALAALAHGIDPARFASPQLHLFAGAAMLGAFFIATDPITAPTTPRGQLIFAIGIGSLTWLIRSFGSFPDGVAFAVLVMNIAVPLLDQLTQPAVFGRSGKRS